jgi:hypothetical protein
MLFFSTVTELSGEASKYSFRLITRRAVGIAAMNALADTCWRHRPHPETELRLGIDAFDATEIRPGDTVVVVGAFVPFLRELKRRRQPYLVLEQDPATLKPDELPFFRPADQAARWCPKRMCC